MFQLLTQSTSSTTDKDQEMDTVDVTTKTELFGSGSDSNSDVDDPKITPKKKLKRQMIIKKISSTLLFWTLICISWTAPFAICPRLVEISNDLVSNCSALGAV